MIVATKPVPISDQLRTKIEESGLTYTEIAEGSGVDRTSISRFMSGERGLSQDAIDALGDYFKLKLFEDGE